MRMVWGGDDERVAIFKLCNFERLLFFSRRPPPFFPPHVFRMFRLAFT